MALASPRSFSMNICLATNRKYVRISQVMLCSLFYNNPDADIHVYLFHCELTESDCSAFSRLAASWSQHISFIDIPAKLFEHLPTTDCWSTETYFRLLMPSFLPADAKRFLYLDADVIIHKSIREFYLTDFSGNDCVVCEDILINRVYKDYYRSLFEELSGRDFTYFNAGVILWNLKQIRNNYEITTYTEKILKYMPVLQCPDQDILNIVHCGKTKNLNWQKYNLQISIAAQKHFSADAVRAVSHMIHFCGPKPWDTNANFEEYYDIPDSSFSELRQIWTDYERLLEQTL